MQDGYILLHRKIKHHRLWQDKPFTRAQAWIDMLMMASHNGNQVLLGNRVYQLQRGQFIRAERTLAQQWGWGRKRVRNFLDLLHDLSMIGTKKEPKGNLITILNYDEYQKTGTKKEPRKAHKGTTKGPQGNQKKECIKECKKEILQFVHLPVEDYERLCSQFGKDDIDSKIEDLENYIGINPKVRIRRYKDHNKVIRTWLKKDEIEPLSEREGICPQCKRNPVKVNGLCEKCNRERMG